MRQIAVFAFIFTNEGWILLKSSMWKIQPSKAAKPMQNASSAKTIDIDLQRASCCCEASSGFVKRITGSGIRGFQSSGGVTKVYTGSNCPTSGVWFCGFQNSWASLLLEVVRHAGDDHAFFEE